MIASSEGAEPPYKITEVSWMWLFFPFEKQQGILQDGIPA